jgi:hypothetical protein
LKGLGIEGKIWWKLMYKWSRMWTEFIQRERIPLIRFCKRGNKPFPSKAPKSPCLFFYFSRKTDETGEYWDFYIECGNMLMNSCTLLWISWLKAVVLNEKFK